MKERLAEQAGTALFWKTVQQAGVKSVFLIRLIVLARLLAPEDFGLLAIAMTAVGFLLKITDVGMIPALVQRPDVTNYHYDTAWTIGILRALIITGIVFLSAPIIAAIFAEPRAVNIIRVLSILPLIEAAASIKIAELTRYLRFRPLAIAKMMDALTNMIVSISLSLSLGVWALVAGTLAGPVAYLTMSYILAPYRPRLFLGRRVAQSLIRYGRWIFVSSIVAVMGSVVLRIVISRQLGVAALGLYFLAAKIAFLPSEVARQVVGEVAFPLYASLQSNIHQVAKAFRSILTGILFMLAPVFVLIIVLAPSLVYDVLGTHWKGTVPLIQLLAVAGIIGLVGDAAAPVLKGLGKPNQFAALEGVQSLLLIISAWIFTKQFGLVGACYAWFPASLACTLTGVIFLMRILPRPLVGIGSPVLAITLASAAGAIVASSIHSLIPNLVGFLIASVLAGLVIGTLLLISDRRYDLGLVNGLIRAIPQLSILVNPTHATDN
jgi:O-antigen/teichoic acid export membrane protein